jgi:hypothetical protein
MRGAGIWMVDVGGGFVPATRVAVNHGFLRTTTNPQGMCTMVEPKIEVLGVYRLPVTDELFREQFAILYDFPMGEAERVAAERKCRKQLESVVLVELVVKSRR